MSKANIAFDYVNLFSEAQYAFQQYQSIQGGVWNETYVVSQETMMNYLVEGRLGDPKAIETLC